MRQHTGKIRASSRTIETATNGIGKLEICDTKYIILNETEVISIDELLVLRGHDWNIVLPLQIDSKTGDIKILLIKENDKGFYDISLTLGLYKKYEIDFAETLRMCWSPVTGNVVVANIGSLVEIFNLPKFGPQFGINNYEDKRVTVVTGFDCSHTKSSLEYDNDSNIMIVYDSKSRFTKAIDLKRIDRYIETVVSENNKVIYSYRNSYGKLLWQKLEVK